jgi:hypothetical protein
VADIARTRVDADVTVLELLKQIFADITTSQHLAQEIDFECAACCPVTKPERHSDAATLIAEVRRLLSIYGGNNSFRHYAGDFLFAARVFIEGRKEIVAYKWSRVGAACVPFKIGEA